MSGGLTKLRIAALHSEENLTEKKSFSVLINPEKIKTTYKIKYAECQAAGAPGANLRFKNMASDKISFSLIFDGTGLIQTATRKMKGKSVPEQIEAFKEITVDYQGQVHRPNFLQLVWGKALFRGYMTSLSIDYKLFKPDGTPIRAEASVDFSTSESTKNAGKKANDSSPDMTHTRKVTSGDRLPSMCNTIYDGVNYYVQVAKFNQLNQIRSLKPGSTISFPPLIS